MSKKKAAAPRKVGVIIANTGTPEAPTRKAVKKYLSQFLMDPRICPMPRPVWWTLLHTHILGKRSRASAEKYEKIWTEEGSPLIAITTSLERGLNEYYADRGLPVMVRAGMSYGKPQIKRVVKELKEAGCTELVVLPMYPQSAFSTTGSVSDGVEKAVRRARFKGDVCLIDGYGEDATYVRAVAASIRNAGFSEEAGDRLLFSFHSIPLKDIEAGDTYELQTGATSLAVAGELGSIAEADHQLSESLRQGPHVAVALHATHAGASGPGRRAGQPPVHGVPQLLRRLPGDALRRALRAGAPLPCGDSRGRR